MSAPLVQNLKSMLLRTPVTVRTASHSVKSAFYGRNYSSSFHTNSSVQAKQMASRQLQTCAKSPEPKVANIFISRVIASLTATVAATGLYGFFVASEAQTMDHSFRGTPQ